MVLMIRDSDVVLKHCVAIKIDRYSKKPVYACMFLTPANDIFMFFLAVMKNS